VVGAEVSDVELDDGAVEVGGALPSESDPPLQAGRARRRTATADAAAVRRRIVMASVPCLRRGCEQFEAPGKRP
jgi:hypothetical protein